jgi:hypothetical protein
MMRIGIAADQGGFELKVQLASAFKTTAKVMRLRTGFRQSGRFGNMNPFDEQTPPTQWAIPGSMDGLT